MGLYNSAFAILGNKDKHHKIKNVMSSYYNPAACIHYKLEEIEDCDFGNDLLYYCVDCNGTFFTRLYDKLSDKYDVQYAFTVFNDVDEFLEQYPILCGSTVITKGGTVETVLACKWQRCAPSYYINPELGYVRYNELELYYNENREVAEDVEDAEVLVTEIIPDTNWDEVVEVNLGNEYEVVQENGKTFIKRIRPKFPKTINECVDLFHSRMDDVSIISNYENMQEELSSNIKKLMYCRDAYWTVLNWVPNLDDDAEKFVIQNVNHKVDFSTTTHINKFLMFPDVYSRNLFYDNFKELIDNCLPFI